MNEDEEVSYGQQYYEDDESDDEDGDYEDELEEALMNCGMLRDGTCMKAGSEECDWECPFSGEQD